MLEVELIAEYLLENSYVSSERDAYEFIPHMSDYWLGSLLESSEIQDLCERQGFRAKKDPNTGKLSKVPHEKTPLYIPMKSGKVKKTPEGKWKIEKNDYMEVHPSARLGRGKVYKNPDSRRAVPNYQALLTTDKRNYNHPQGGAEYPGTNKGVPAGYARGVKKRRGAPISQPETPVSRIKRELAAKRAPKRVSRTGKRLQPWDAS